MTARKRLSQAGHMRVTEAIAAPAGCIPKLSAQLSMDKTMSGSSVMAGTDTVAVSETVATR